MKFQIARARQYFADAEAGVDHLDSDARWPVWSALILYRYVQPYHQAYRCAAQDLALSFHKEQELLKDLLL